MEKVNHLSVHDPVRGILGWWDCSIDPLLEGETLTLTFEATGFTIVLSLDPKIDNTNGGGEVYLDGQRVYAKVSKRKGQAPWKR